jgi:transposase
MLPMPWHETDACKERMKLLISIEEGMSVSEACLLHGVSRKTGHKWINRYQAEGALGLADRPRAHHSHAHQTPAGICSGSINL